MLVLGSSHTQGKEVESGKRYTDILNDLLCTANNKTRSLEVYNMGADGHHYPDLVSGFEAAIKEFPESSCVVLETGSTDFEIEELKAALTSRSYDDTQTGSQLAGSMSTSLKAKAFMKESFPLILCLKNKVSNSDIRFNGAFGLFNSITTPPSDMPYDEDAYYHAVKATVEKMAHIYDGKIVIMYHHAMNLNCDGSLEKDNEKTYDAFKRAVEDAGAVFLDLQNAFLQAYDRYDVLPYGFNNTSPGTGHMNQYGHQIAALELYTVLERMR